MATGIDGRQALIEAAIDAIAAHGTARTHPKNLTELLGLSKSLVNFHFEGRDGLLAEAVTTALERQVEGLRLAAGAAGADPMARLLAWADAFLTWSAANPGLAAATAFPESCTETDILADGVATRLTTATVARWDMLCALVRDARDVVGDESVGGLEDHTGLDGDSDRMIWWLLQGAAVSVANRPDHLDGIRAAVRARVLMLVAT